MPGGILRLISALVKRYLCGALVSSVLLLGIKRPDEGIKAAMKTSIFQGERCNMAMLNTDQSAKQIVAVLITSMRVWN